MDTTVKTAICPATPLKQGNVYFYPLTTHNQVILKEGYTWDDVFAAIDFLNSGGSIGGGGEVVIGVTSVNGQTGAVTLTAENVKARPDSWVPTIIQIPDLEKRLSKAEAGIVTINGVEADDSGNINLENIVKTENNITFGNFSAGTITADKIIGAVYE